jgi:hypothetical protein
VYVLAESTELAWRPAGTLAALFLITSLHSNICRYMLDYVQFTSKVCLNIWTLLFYNKAKNVYMYLTYALPFQVCEHAMCIGYVFNLRRLIFK